MKEYQKRFEHLKSETELYYQTEFEFLAEDSAENIRIKTSVLDLLAKVQNEEPVIDSDSFKMNVIEYFCGVCGCGEDLEVVQRYCPSVLSSEEVEFIKHNSALARWL